VGGEIRYLGSVDGGDGGGGDDVGVGVVGLGEGRGGYLSGGEGGRNMANSRCRAYM
jgi:hypothetical protein